MKPIIFHTNLKINFNNCAQTDSNSRGEIERKINKNKGNYFSLFLF